MGSSKRKKASKPGKKTVSKRIARIRSAFARAGKGSSSRVTIVRAGSKKQKAAARKVTYISVIPFREKPFKDFSERPFKDFSERPFKDWSDFWNYIAWKDRAK